MSGERPPWIFEPNRGSSSNGFLIPEQQTRYFRPDQTQESARLEPAKPGQFNWTALVVGITVALVLSAVIVAVAVVVSEQSSAANEASNASPNPSSNSSISSSTGQTISSVSSTAYMYSPALCSDNTWIKMPGVYVGNTNIILSGVLSPAECQSRCLERSICLDVWWQSNSADGCQLVYYDPSISFGYGPQYTYYALIRNQSNCDDNGTCVYNWTMAYNLQSLGSTRIPYIYNMNDCVISCQNNSNCSGADWDTNQNYCWQLLNMNNISQTQFGRGFLHFNKDCRVPNGLTISSVSSTPYSPASIASPNPFSNSSTSSSTGQTISPVLSTTYMYSPALCSDNTWIKMPGVYVYGTTISPPGVFSPTECQSRCIELSICLGAWWNSYSVEGCQLVYYDSPLGYGYGPQYTYYALIRNQSNCDGNGTCVYIWIQAYNLQSLGATRIPYIYSINDCVISCQNIFNCSGVDWDTNQNYCWQLLNTNNNSRTQFGSGIAHFDKDCRDPNATTTTLSTPSTTSSLCPYYNARYCEPTNQCIFAYQICDKYQDCPNDIDETNCTCDANHYQCQNGRCIYRSWLCDGVDDCPRKDDENPPQCSTCDASKFLCGKTHTCISMSQRCDGIANCSDSVDEANCLTLDGNGTESEWNNFTTYLVNATYRGISGYFICSDNWNDTWSDSVCQNIGYRKSSATSFQSVSGTASFLTLNLSVSSPNLLAHLQTSGCISNKAVAVSCADSECGTRGALLPDSVGPYIINGQRAKRGAWPWQVLFEIGTYYSSTDLSSFDPFSFCGGVVLNDRWILTAGHCTQAPNGFSYVGQVRPENVRISLGSLSRTGDNDTVLARVDQVYTHPYYVSDPDNDVGLLRLSEPLTFTDTIRPICLPSSTEDLSQFRVCVDTGYGQTILGTSSDYLLQVRMNVIPYNDCYYYNGYYIRGETQICIGTLPTENDNNICSGDSGGPFACEDLTGTWKVIGINSYVINIPQTCSRSIVARVTVYVDWIEQTMAANPV